MPEYYLPTKNPRIFHTGWIQPYNQLCQIDHYFAVVPNKDGAGSKVFSIAAHKGISYDMLPTMAGPQVPTMTKYKDIKDDSELVIKILANFLETLDSKK